MENACAPHCIIFVIRLPCPTRFFFKTARIDKRNKTEFPQYFTEIQLDYYIRFLENAKQQRNVPQITAFIILPYFVNVCQAFFGVFIYFLALSLLMALALGADYHNSAVSLDNFALVAHRFYRRSDFHCIFSLLIKLFCR